MGKIISFLVGCLVGIGHLFAVQKEDKPQTICLNMIVRNESHIIEQCLSSVKDLIHYWVIVDTGSTDGTQNIIREMMKDIPGELHERPWVDFAHNRNEALAWAKGRCDYILFMDADEILTCADDFAMPRLDKDSYNFKIRQVGTGVDYQRVLLIRDRLPWKWEGVLHETIVGPLPHSRETLPGVIALSYTQGYRSRDPQKYLKDAQVLEKALKEDPTNERYVYYLAQSYLNVPDYPKALEYYQKRAAMGGWDEERFFAMYSAGNLQAKLGLPVETVMKSYLDAHQFRPTRAEPLYHVAQYYIQSKNYLLGYLLTNYALSIPPSSDAMFVETWIYEWGILLQFSECCYFLGRYEEARQAIHKLMTVSTLPEEVRASLRKNLLLVSSK